MERKATKPLGAGAREERLKAALKANLGRRKAQAKAQAAVRDEGQAGNAVDEKNICDEKES